jgi:hypothetical protein
MTLDENFEIPSLAERDEVRQIAKEDRTSFAVAMVGYGELKKVLKLEESRMRVHNAKYPNQRPYDLAEVEDIEDRILAMRKVFGMTLAEAVQLFVKDPKSGFVKKLKGAKRKCRHEGCERNCAPESWYFCKHHLVPQEDVEGDLIYATPPPKSIGRMVTASQHRAAEGAEDDTQDLSGATDTEA